MINLDTMTADELLAFQREHRNGKGFHTLFPGKPSEDAKIATDDLSHYAFWKRKALLTGNPFEALKYQLSADKGFYNGLPTWAKWKGPQV